MRKAVFLLVLFVLVAQPAISQSVADPDNCLVFPKGQKICMSTGGGMVVIPAGLMLENGGRYFGSNGMSVTSGEGAGGAIFLGDRQKNSGMVVGLGGAVVYGQFAVMPKGALVPLFPQYSDNGYTWYYSDQDLTASDRFSAEDRPTVRVPVPSMLRLYGNVDSATKGGYDVYLSSRELGKGVEVIEKTPEFFVVRSLSKEPVRFSYAVRAYAKGHERRPFLRVQNDEFQSEPKNDREVLVLTPESQ